MERQVFIVVTLVVTNSLVALDDEGTNTENLESRSNLKTTRKNISVVEF